MRGIVQPQLLLAVINVVNTPQQDAARRSGEVNNEQADCLFLTHMLFTPFCLPGLHTIYGSHPH